MKVFESMKMIHYDARAKGIMIKLLVIGTSQIHSFKDGSQIITNQIKAAQMYA